MYKKIKNKQESRTEKIFKEATEKLKQIVDSGEYEKFLKFQKHFNTYSFMNRILIYSQCPEATKVAGKKTWMKLGREVINQNKRIYIVAPIPKSNTRGEAIPVETEKLNSSDKAELYEKLKSFSIVPVVESKMNGSMHGYYSKKESKIAINKTLSTDDKAATLLHEITHSLYDDFDYSKNRDLSEICVESVAYIVADHYGLDASKCSFNYIIKWAKGEPKKVINLGGKITKCADDFI